ncbi:MAG: cell division protein FtsA [Paludibacteraceae bacterium]|nr:cell division protein FtsA [Paludibacteraceae bacterium]
MSDSNLYYAIDFGSYKIKSMLAKKDDNGKIEVISVDEISSKGIMRGSIMNPTHAAMQVSGLLKVVQNHRAMTNLKINKAYSGYGGFSMSSSVLTDICDYPGNKRLTKAVIDEMKEEVVKNKLDAKYSSFLTLDLEFKIDGIDCESALDCEGKNIVSKFLNIHGLQSLDMKVSETLPRVPVNQAGLFVSPLEMAYSATSPKDREIGCAVVDFGHSTTSVVVFNENKVRHVGVIPFGSNSITEDLKALKLSKMQAENIKLRYGAVRSTQRTQMLSINAGDETLQIDTYDLNKRIEARVDEIMDQVCGEVDKSGCYNKLNSGIILTGGGSKLNGLCEFVQFKSGMDVRFADWSNVLKADTPENFIQPEYAVLYGLILRASENCTVSKEIPGDTKLPSTPVQEKSTDGKKKTNIWNRVGGLFFNDSESGFDK